MPPSITQIDMPEFQEENVKTLTAEKPWMKERTFILAKTVEEVKAFIDQAIATGKCVIDLETTGLSARKKKEKDPITGEIKIVPATKIVGVGLCYDPKMGMYIPLNHKIDPECNLPFDAVMEEVRRLVAFCVTIYHNAKFDVGQLKHYGIYPETYKDFADTQILARLYDAGFKELKLKVLSEKLLNQPMIKFSEITQSTNRFDLVSPLTGYIYGVSDCVCTMDLYNFFMASEIIQDQSVIHNLERRIVFCVLEIESNYIKTDTAYLQGLKDKAEKRIAEIEKEIFELAGHTFNLGSPQQLGKVLFEELKFKCEGKTESGQYATDNAALIKLAATYPICKKIIGYRCLEKSLGTYIKNLLLNQDDDGCIKLGFHQVGTETGRFSSPGGQGIDIDGYCGVNVQSIPKSTKDNDSGEELPDIRKAFIARPGKTIVAADFENEEMRVAANLSRETTWINAVNNGVDFHTATGAGIAGKPIDKITPAERALGKTTNFLALYLGGARSLAAKAEISENEAKRVLTAFYAAVPRLKAYQNNEIKKARKLKYVKTIFGRKRPLAKLYDSGDRASENHADRAAVNMCIQGCCADLMKTAMSKTYAWIHRNNLQDDIKVLITMHDELVFEITTEKIELYVPELAKIMMLPEIINDVLHWPLPLTVDVKYGDSWRVKKKFFDDFPNARARLSEPLMEFNVASPSPAPEAVSVEPPVLEPVPPVAYVEEKPQEVMPQEEKAIETTQVQQPEEPTLPTNTSLKILDIGKDLNENSEQFIYTIRDTGAVTLLHLNHIIEFFLKENLDKYNGPKKIVKIKDAQGNSMLVDEYKFPVDAFRALARFFRV